jgi:hypothetical protein
VQLASLVPQPVRQLVPLAQTRWPGQALVPPPLAQVPVPSQVLPVVSMLPLQVALVHDVPLGQSSQTPALQSPSRPQVVWLLAVHIIRGSDMPSLAAPQTPFAPVFFSALAQAWQAVLHAWLQQ